VGTELLLGLLRAVWPDLLAVLLITTAGPALLAKRGMGGLGVTVTSAWLRRRNSREGSVKDQFPPSACGCANGFGRVALALP
jgi:hypothetical protein